jgi:hypothetical protein
MSQLLPLEGLLLNLKQEIPRGRREYLPKELALERLKKWTGQDFGHDVAAWERWLAEHGDAPWK